MTRTILYVVIDLDVGGAERHLVQVLPALLREGYCPVVHTLTHKGRLAAQLEAAGVEVITPALASLRQALPTSWQLALSLPFVVPSLCWNLHRLRPAVVHFFLPAAYLVGELCSQLMRVPVRVMSRRSLNLYQHDHPYLTRLERRLHKRLSAAIGNSRAVTRELEQEGIPPDRIGVIHNGIDLSRFRGLPGREQVRAGLDIAVDAFVITIVASLIHYKGHDDLLAALHAVRDRLPGGWRLLCVGRDLGMGDQLCARARGLGLASHVRWLGERQDVPEILYASDIGVLCSHQEGFSNSLLEGMAAELPMVATDVGGNPEAVLDGTTGRLVPVRSPRALGEAIVSLSGDPVVRRCMGANARQRVQSGFSLDTCVQRYVRLYEGLCAAKPATVRDMLAGATEPSGGA